MKHIIYGFKFTTISLCECLLHITQYAGSLVDMVLICMNQCSVWHRSYAQKPGRKYTERSHRSSHTAFKTELTV